MHKAHLKAKRNVRIAQIGRKPYAAVMGAHAPRAPVLTRYV